MTMYFRLLELGSIIATVILLLAVEEWISAEQMQLLYEPFVWTCLKIPYFVIRHEWWIELLGNIRIAFRSLFSPEP